MQAGSSSTKHPTSIRRHKPQSETGEGLVPAAHMVCSIAKFGVWMIPWCFTRFT